MKLKGHKGNKYTNMPMRKGPGEPAGRGFGGRMKGPRKGSKK